MVSQESSQPGQGPLPEAFSSAALRATARRAAARAREAASGPRMSNSSASGARGLPEQQQRAHVAVRPQIASDTHFHRRSEGAADGGAGNRDFSSAAQGLAASKPRSDRDLVSEALVRAAKPGSELVIPPGARLTPAARDLAFEKGVTFTTGRYAEPSGPVAPGAIRRSARIAVASDHGGFGLKDQLIPLLKEMGERPMDLGPAGASPSVDYPDFAALVAKEVSEGRADLGIVVDGAGIGSAMVANKFPGVKAANCWNEASARNAREHNHANVLTLGSGHLDLSSARLVIAAFLQTPHGGDRHARRAGKLDQIERAQLRTASLSKTFDEGR